MKIIGARKGIGLTGMLGGFISSTAVTISLANQSKTLNEVKRPFIFAILIASTIMFFRVLLEVFVLNRELLKFVIIPIGVMSIVGILFVLFYSRMKSKNILLTLLLTIPAFTFTQVDK